jgi:hypothetical protein
MSKHQIVRELRREIRKVNEKIDLRIIQGMSYREESRRHKFLVSQLARLQPRHAPLFGGFALAQLFML